MRGEMSRQERDRAAAAYSARCRRRRQREELWRAELRARLAALGVCLCLLVWILRTM